MKIVICKECLGMIVPSFGVAKGCDCGRVDAYYVTQTRLIVRGSGKVIAIHNTDIQKSIECNGGETLKCWVLPDDHPDIGRKNESPSSPIEDRQQEVGWVHRFNSEQDFLDYLKINRDFASLQNELAEVKMERQNWKDMWNVAVEKNGEYRKRYQEERRQKLEWQKEYQRLKHSTQNPLK